ncbi:hypothetical protein AV530_004904 [Patagioenas fasciata monilis]|uniref:Cation-transporting P-type ATPase C-terminal domain-containing protein n=1 Tax=Patagioenas fasciata monilis TaxID=372326 RepID=A0A1V4K4Y1_PATFA|nr:hypothetical protein AV530_004904 [Patagioenas fasciata monilis]
MENRLKQDMKPVLQELAAACIGGMMVTGDNLQTAVTVARKAEDQTLFSTSPWGNGTSSGAQSTVLSYEDTTLWPLSSISCIIVASTFSKGKPFRKLIYTNCK